MYLLGAGSNPRVVAWYLSFKFLPKLTSTLLEYSRNRIHWQWQFRKVNNLHIQTFSTTLLCQHFCQSSIPSNNFIRMNRLSLNSGVDPGQDLRGPHLIQFIVLFVKQVLNTIVYIRKFAVWEGPWPQTPLDRPMITLTLLQEQLGL